jgi:predicted  nucleic acid-binding Zn-ribbon protein
MDRHVDAKVRVSVGNVSAGCPKCGATEFKRAFSTPSVHTDVLICVACKAETPRTVLIAQVGDEVVRRAQKTLEDVRALRAKLGGKKND